jgi:uncharacterized membrane protein
VGVAEGHGRTAEQGGRETAEGGAAPVGPRRGSHLAGVAAGFAVVALALGVLQFALAHPPARVRGRSGFLYGTVLQAGSPRRDGLVRLSDGRVVRAQVDLPAAAASTLPPALLPHFAAGDRVQVEYQVGPGGRVTYAVTDWERGPTLVWLLLLFVFVVAAVARGKGLRALAGTAASLGIVLLVLVPAILGGASPVLAALAGSGGILTLSMYFVHGVNWKTTAALAGTIAAVALALLIGRSFLQAGHILSFGDEESVFIAQADARVNLAGLVLAAVILGALGALVDVTVGQAATVAELAGARPDLGVRALYARAMNVGFDHIGSLVNTLVLAYVSSALPLLLLLRLGAQGWRQELNSELIAYQLVHTLVGGVALVLAVPATTVVAALFFAHGRHAASAAGEHGHSHLHAHG